VKRTATDRNGHRLLFLTRPGGRRVTGGGPSDTNKCEPNRCLAVCWRNAVTTVRIVFAQHIRPARLPDGSDDPDRRLHQQLIVLADTVPTEDGGHRAVPLWLRIHKGLRARLAQLDRPAGDAEVASGLLETAVRLPARRCQARRDGVGAVMTMILLVISGTGPKITFCPGSLVA
jgi:hypothetical protein